MPHDTREQIYLAALLAISSREPRLTSVEHLQIVARRAVTEANCRSSQDMPCPEEALQYADYFS